MPSLTSVLPVSQIAALLAVGGASMALTHRPIVGSADRAVVVTSLTPNVAQGGELVLDVAVRAPSSLVKSIDVEIPPYPPVRAERRRAAGESAVPTSYRIEVPLPEDAKTSEVFVDVGTVAVVPRADMVPHAQKTTLRVPLRVWTRLELQVLDAVLGLMRAIWLGIGAFATARGIASHRRANRDEPVGAPLGGYALLVGFSVATFLVVGRPLVSMLRYFGDGPAVAVSAAAVALVLGAARLLAGRDPPPALDGSLAPAPAAASYRTHAPRLDDRAWAAIRDALYAVPGLSVAQRNGEVEVSRSGWQRFRPAFVTLRLADQGGEPSIVLRFNDSDLLFEVAKQTTGELGPVRLDLARDRAIFRYVVDHSTDVGAVVADFRREQRNHIDLQESRAALLDLLAKRAGLED